MTTITEPPRYLETVRKLLAKAEDPGCTSDEAQALTERAAGIMAKYGITRALLGATEPQADKPSSKIIECWNPFARVDAQMLCGLAAALRCQPILLPSRESQRVHVFG